MCWDILKLMTAIITTFATFRKGPQDKYRVIDIHHEDMNVECVKEINLNMETLIKALNLMMRDMKALATENDDKTKKPWHFRWSSEVARFVFEKAVKEFDKKYYVESKPIKIRKIPVRTLRKDIREKMHGDKWSYKYIKKMLIDDVIGKYKVTADTNSEHFIHLFRQYMSYRVKQTDGTDECDQTIEQKKREERKYARERGIDRRYMNELYKRLDEREAERIRREDIRVTDEDVDEYDIDMSDWKDNPTKKDEQCEQDLTIHHDEFYLDMCGVKGMLRKLAKKLWKDLYRIMV